MSGEIGYSKSASAEVQTEISQIVGQLESIISSYEADTNSVMGETVIQGAGETLQEKSKEWNKAAELARGIVDTVRSVMEENDGIADTALSRARNAAESI